MVRAAIATLIVFNCAFAQTPGATSADYPSRAVRFFVTYPPGGGNDIIARMIAHKLTERLGQPFVVDNRSGAGGTIGTAAAAAAAPDGYTIILVSTPYAMSPALYSNLSWDPVKSLVPITLIGSSPNMLVVHPSVPARNVAELLQLAKARPGELNIATLGGGTPQHLAGELFKMMGKVDIVQIPYKGSAPGIQDLVAGQVQLMFNAMPSTLPHVKSGRLRALAITAKDRSPLVPDLPTVAETLPGYEVTTWFGVLAPAATPAAIVSRLNQEIVAILQMPDIRSRLADMGVDVVASSPEAFSAYIRTELVKWTELIKAVGLKPE
jgi:tripartite-type tricarboxylate transporter receptor subunit TctC